jgi:Tol biopolymer transport system component
MGTWPFCNYLSGPAYAPRGTRIAVMVRVHAEPALWLLNSAGRFASSQRLAHAYTDPRWAPDGSALVAVRRFDAPPDVFWHSVFVIGRDGSERELVSNAYSPDWCAGDRIVVVWFGMLRILDPHGVRRGRSIPNASEPSCSPDGERVAFTRDGDIWTAPLTAGRARKLTSGYAPVWSPDGRQIAFLRYRYDDTTGSEKISLHRVGLRRGIVRQVSAEPVMEDGDHAGASLDGPEWRPLRGRR